MLKNLYWKLTVAFMLVAFITAGMVAVFIRLTSADRLSQLMIRPGNQRPANGVEDVLFRIWILEWCITVLGSTSVSLFTHTCCREHQQRQLDQFDNYSIESIRANWAGKRKWNPWRKHSQGNNSQPGSNTGQGGNNPRNNFGLADADGVVVVSVDPKFLVDKKLQQQCWKTAHRLPSVVGGWNDFGQSPRFWFYPTGITVFAKNDGSIDLWKPGRIGHCFWSLVFSWPEDWPIPWRPWPRLPKKFHRVSSINRSKSKSNDEIGQLAQAFKPDEPAGGQKQSTAQQMTADIAHDLRTPLTVISGYHRIDAGRGFWKPTPQRLALIYSEIERLQNLVGDLGMLSRADAGELSLTPQNLVPKALLDWSAALFRHLAEQKKISIQVKADENLPKYSSTKPEWCRWW